MLSRSSRRATALESILCCFLSFLIALLSLPLSATSVLAKPNSEKSRISSPVVAPSEIPPTTQIAEPKQTPIDFSFVEVKPAGNLSSRKSTVPTEALPLKKLQEIFARSNPLTVKSEKKFVLPENSLVKPTLPGIRTQEVFPPPPAIVEKPEASQIIAKVNPLAVRRITPSGEIDEAQQLSITFSQPMIAMSDVDEADTKQIIKLTPEPDGQWHWQDVQTITFDPKEKRFPKATNYEVRIPAETVSNLGGKLTKEAIYSFSTPPLKAFSITPSGTSVPTNPPICLFFNQRVDKSQALKFIKLRSSSKEFSLHVLSDEEIKKSKVFGSSFEYYSKAEHLLLEVNEQLPINTAFKLTLEKGMPSAEGPRGSEGQEFTFSTYGPLKIDQERRLGDYPHNQTIRFTNPLDSKSISQKNVKVEPEVEEFGVDFWGDDSINLRGMFKPLTEYTVHVDRTIRDIFGQNLSGKLSTSFTPKKVPFSLYAERSFSTFARGQRPSSIFVAQEAGELLVTIYKGLPSAFLSRDFSNLDGENINLPILGQQKFKVGHDSKRIEVDLHKYLDEGVGQFYVVAKAIPLRGESLYNPNFRKPAEAMWVQVTDIGLDAFRGRQLVTLANSMVDGKPLKNLDITYSESGQKAVSDSRGIAKFEINNSNHKTLITAQKGKDISLLSGIWHYHTPSRQKWYLVTDRNLYKPGETVNVKGWTRKISFDENEILKIEKPKFEFIEYTVTSSEGAKVGSGKSKVDAYGGIDFKVKLPDKVNLGNSFISIRPAKVINDAITSKLQPSAVQVEEDFEIESRGATLEFQIQEFRRPEFEMTLDSSKGNALLFENATQLRTNARYFSGGALGKSPVKWTATSSQTSFTPPGRHEFAFQDSNRRDTTEYFIGSNKILEGTTDLQGNDVVEIKLNERSYPFPVSVSCEASVVDVNRQTWTQNLSLLYHPADLYVGLRCNEYQIDRNKNLKIGAIVADRDGKAIEDVAINLNLVRRENNADKSIQQITVTSKNQPVQIEFEKQEPGTYIVFSSIVDSQNRKNTSSLAMNIVEKIQKQSVLAQQQKITFTSDKAEYKPGEVAKLSIDSPFFPANGVLNIRRNEGIIDTIPIELKSDKTTVNIPITAELVPSATAEICLEKSSEDFGTNSILLKIVPERKVLQLDVKASSREAVPGEITTLVVDLKTNENKPVANGQVAIAVADESVLALAGYKWGDPINAFYEVSLAQTSNGFTRSTVVRSKEEVPSLSHKPAPDLASLPASTSLPPRGQTGQLAQLSSVSRPRDVNMFQVEPTVIDERHYSTGRAERHQKTSPSLPEAPAIAVRSNFSALALFEPVVITDKYGKANIKFKLPDSVTRYRIMAIAAVDNDKFGSSESSLTTKLPLMVKPSAPRFLNFGDTCELPVVIENQTNKKLKVEVALRGENISIGNVRENFSSLPSEEIAPTGESALGKIVEVPANDRVEVRFNITTRNEGVAGFQCTAVAGNLADSAEFSVPVYVPASMETFATYGQIDTGAVQQKLDFPTNVFKQVGGLSIATSSTAMQALTDAYFYLRDYQYNCTEQISSRLIAMLSLQNILTAFGKLDGDAGSQFRSSIQKDLDDLNKRQNDDGSFGLWSKNENKRWPYLTIQVAEALRLAKEKDYRVDEVVYRRCYDNIRNIENYFDSEYSDQCRLSLLAKALNIRYRSGDVDSAKAKEVIQYAFKRILKTLKKTEKNSQRKIEDVPSDILKQEIPLDASALLLPVIAKDISASNEIAVLKRQIENEILETASTASTNSAGYGDWNYFLFYSPRRTDAIVLQALIDAEPESPLIPKLVKGLLGHRKNGRWEGTQENGCILQTLDSYFNKYEKETPNFETQSWLDNTLVSLQTFKGRSTETKDVNVPTEYLLKAAPKDVLITKKGPGRLYYRLAMDYARKELNIPAKSRGFKVSRTYEFVDNKDDVSKDKNGVWHFKSGAGVRVKINFEALGARYHVAMMDPIPAGAEPINSALQGSRQTNSNGNIVPFERARWRIWNWNWYEHQNLRDHQAEAFASVLWKGNHEFTYMIHATTPGIFRVPPTKVEEMYAEETFGRSSSEQVIIE